MTEAEQQEKLQQFQGRFRLHQHHWDRPEEIHHFGETQDGTAVTANRLLLEFDFVLGLGSVVPHRVKGLSGGAKIMFPGVSGPEMMNRNQWDASLRMSETVMGTAENPMRLRMEEAARIAGLHYIANVVRDREGRIAGCFAGDFVAAHRAAGKLAVEINEVRLPDRADIVIIDAHPADRDFWQSAKGAYAGSMAVRAGGTLILVAPNPEGIASDHPLLLETGYRPHKEVVRMVESGEVTDIVGAAILGDMAQIIDSAHCVMVSPGVQREEAQKIGFDYALTVQEALDASFERHGRDATVAVLRHGGHILPRADPGVKLSRPE
jgi:nickel-dependent lactate racemase